MAKLTDNQIAFLEGFKISTEGFSGEMYHGRTDEEIWEDIKGDYIFNE